mmetsp:Transcript_55635/g.65016  ORF Transcript_55635/g.65016 Transcript_55635/m.65016 type:complete len:178 (+) Transcript_55635:53-586(+)
MKMTKQRIRAGATRSSKLCCDIFMLSCALISVKPSCSLQMNSIKIMNKPTITIFRNSESNCKGRRAALSKFAGLLGFGIVNTWCPLPVHAAESNDKSTRYLTGKAPKVPGEKEKDKSDTKGTKRDPSFLRSISDCKGKCESTNGPDGLARSKEDCLSDCQDICCTTYEQCTFAIIAR